MDEEGLDQGGVKKEFFQLLTREIFNEVSAPLRRLAKHPAGLCIAPSPPPSVWATAFVVYCRALTLLLRDVLPQSSLE